MRLGRCGERRPLECDTVLRPIKILNCKKLARVMLTSKGAVHLNQSGGIKVVGCLRFILGAKDTRDFN